MGARAMTERRKGWRAGYLLSVMILSVFGVLMFLQGRAYLPEGTATPAMPMSSRTMLAPDFSLRDLDGNVQHLSSFRGRVVLLNFWATWCLPCQTEMPMMEALYQAYKDHGFEVVAVSSDAPGAEVVQPFVSQQQVSFTTLLDASGQVTRLYGVTSLPTTYLLDREGRLVTVEIGGHDWSAAGARALIRSLLETTQPAAVASGVEAAREMSSTAAQRNTAGP
jgi:peroxiredoxin